MQEIPLATEVETYLRSKESAGYVATIVKYEHPVDILYYGINLLLFRRMGAEISKSGRQWGVLCQLADEYRIRMQAHTLAVVTEYFHYREVGYTRIQMLKRSKGCYKIKPTPYVDVLPGQSEAVEYYENEIHPDLFDSMYATGNCNSLEAADIGKAARNHSKLTDRILSLDKYNPRLIGTVAIPSDFICYDKIPLPAPIQV